MKVRYRNAAPLRYSKTLRLLSIVGGGLLAAVGLELFLMPHKLLPGGIAGLSALLSHVTEMRLGLFLFLFNLPFILMSRRQINLRFALYTMLGLICLTAGSLALHHFPAAISEPLPAAIAGGLCLGFGLGISVRFGGLTAGSEKQSVRLLNGGPPKSAEMPIMLFNMLILLYGGSLFGWDQAMYSIIAYLLAFEALRFSLRDLSLTQAVFITSSKCEEIRRKLQQSLDREVKLVKSTGPQGEPGTVFCLASRLEEEQLASIVHDCDQDSKIVINAARNNRISALFRNKPPG
ncbi:YitT family protein [Paenibacillus sp. FSL H7-0756]|uniref:YitT family protein n=1 Tax=unclassified Paenibacillus TaxID=185978 RepID=UPI0030FBF8E1